ncbi:N-ethylmaleimide reductase [Aspergillus homomorphus CBS 101889]|uniref:N-ethylmaleimide reductase n=1 Tax=Aspergillus homomorphus (strain CBS 101889) TaxID=1450537 RepID=A0A395HGK9_ASPHC|nr:N-ethylmaleimide reductase [Aspergillus homomorphus CBS 101889]RAL07051.1 N-ethylmaleimide reductase [Aspergillus homomorphus CBS 101889]
MTPYKLFEPLQIENLHLEHRFVMAPLTRFRADAEHVPLAIAKKYYEQRASVPGTLLIAEATQISAPEGGISHGPGIWSEPQIQRWIEITDAVQRRTSFIGGYELHAPSAIPMDPGMPVLKELRDEETLNIINDFATAAKNAIRAGYDGVEIHGANGYLVDQFLQDVSNRRVDRWGGSVSNRALFGLEVARAAVDAIAAMKMTDPVPQFAYFVEQLRQLNLAYLHLIESRVINNVDCEQGESNKFLLDIWGKTSPVRVAGGYTLENAEAALQGDYKDYEVAIVFGRHFLSNPDLPFRIRQGLDLNPYHRESFYTPIQERGYSDYTFSAEFAKVDA